MTGIERLTPTDLINVYVETPSAPARVGALVLLDGTLSLDEVRTRIAERVPGVPRLRQVIHRPGWLAGRPIWIDAPTVDVAYHVREVTLGLLAAGTALVAFPAEVSAAAPQAEATVGSDLPGR